MRIKDILMSPGAILLTGLNDVNIDNPMNGQELTYQSDSQKWENVMPCGATGYTDRGDPSSYDFSKTDFTTDGEWHVLDLSVLVPEGTTLVHLLIGANTAYNNSWIRFCKKGSVNRLNADWMSIRHGNTENYESKWVACDADRKIEYWMSSRVWIQLDVLVRGWI